MKPDSLLIRYRISPDDILYLQADHVKVRVYLADGRRIVQRDALRDLLAQIPAN